MSPGEPDDGESRPVLVVRCAGAAMSEVPREVKDFWLTGQHFAAGDPVRALVCLLPLWLSEEATEQRVRCMVAIGAALSGVVGAECSGEGLVDRLIAAGAARDKNVIAEVIAAHSGVELADVLVELVARFVAAIGRPPVEVAPCDAPGGRPVPEETPAGCRLSGPPASGLAPGSQPVPPTGRRFWFRSRRRGGWRS